MEEECRKVNIIFSADSLRYMALASGKYLTQPFNLRWLIPSLLGRNLMNWMIWNTIALITIYPLLYLYLKGWGLTRRQSLTGCLLYTALPLTGYLFRRPVLLDGFLIAGALLVAVLLKHGFRWQGYSILLPLMLVKENMGVLVFVYTMDFIPVLFTIIPVLAAKPEANTDFIHPDRGFRSLRIVLDNLKYMSWRVHKTLLPWNISLLGFLKPSIHLFLALGYGYTVCLLAGLDIRYFMSVFPVVILHAVRFITPYLKEKPDYEYEVLGG